MTPGAPNSPGRQQPEANIAHPNLKTAVAAKPPGVRIPLPPPTESITANRVSAPSAADFGATESSSPSRIYWNSRVVH
jgi:hypothetical protein